MNAITKTEPAIKSNKRGLATYEAFQHELKEREQAIVGMLPQHIGKQRFINSTIAAVKQNPDLLTATPRSLFNSITKSAQDGLLPDGREGVITIYNEKQKDNSYAKVAQWNPMIYGLRKRARELDDIIINAQVVHEHDKFVRHEGDDPKIEHDPAPLGQPRGRMIGAYATFRNATGILHREVMEAEQIEAVRAQSKAPNSLMWTKFVEEGWRKTVVRRGIKSVPCGEKLEEIVRRDDDLFDFDQSAASNRPQLKVVQPNGSGEKRALPPVVGEDAEIVDAPEAPAPETTISEPSWRDSTIAALKNCMDAETLFGLNRSTITPAKGDASAEDWDAVQLVYRQTFDRLSMADE